MRGVVLERRLAAHERHAAAAAVGGGDPAHDLLDHQAQREPVLRPVGAQRRPRPRARGNHVLGAPALEHADRQHGRAVRVDAAPHLGVERDDDLRDREDRVAPMMRVGAVRGLALDA